MLVVLNASVALPRRAAPHAPPRSCGTWPDRCRPGAIAPSCSGAGRTLCGGRILVAHAASL